MYFTFVGEISFNGMETEHPFLREGKTKNNAPYKTINMSIASTKNNRAYTEIFGMERKTIKTRSVTGNNVEIAWEDRLDADVVKSVDGRNKFIIVNGDERNEFITELDLINYIADHVDELNGKIARVVGQSSKNEYKGKVSNRFTFRSIYILDDDTTEKRTLQLRTPMYFNKDGIDTTDWAENKQLTITAYTREFVKKDEEGNSIYKYYEQPVILDASKIDFENERHVKSLKFRLKQLGCELADGNKIKVVMKKGYYSNNLTLSYVNGAEEVEFTYDMLTDTQKEMVDLGMKAVDDFKPSGSTFGDRVVLYKVINFELKGDYEDGIVKEDDETSKEIEENIYVPVPVEEKMDDYEETAPETPAKEESKADVDDEDLFAD